MGHLGLHSLGAYTATGFIASAVALLVGNTSHNWTWVEQAGVAVYGERTVTGGKLIVAVAGDVAGSTPGGTITPDVAAVNKIWIGCGFVPTGSAFVWAGWTNANPTTNGVWAGWSPLCIANANTVANRLQIWTYEGGAVFRAESTVTSTARVAIVGDMLLPYTDADQRLVTAPTPQAHGACIGWWTIGGSNPVAATWLSAGFATAAEFGLNNTTGNQPKGRYLDGTTLRPCQLHFPLKSAPTATICTAAGKAGGLAAFVQRADTAPDETIVGIHPHIIGATGAAGGEVQVSGLPVLLIVGRDSGAPQQALQMSVARRSRTL